MTNLERLQAAEGALRNDGRIVLAHVVQDAREEIEALREENTRLRNAIADARWAPSELC